MIEPQKITAARSPQRLFIYGKPKVGKTSAVAQLPKHLIIDTEVKGKSDGQLLGGTSYCEGATSIVVESLNGLKACLSYLQSNPESHDFVVLDTIDHIEAWVTDAVCRTHNVKHIGDIPHGKGWSLMRSQVIAIVEQFARASKHIIIVGHQKDGHDEEGVEVQKINLTGKLKTHLCSIMDGVGRITREEDTLMIDFRTGINTDAGCRVPTLAGQLIELKWDIVYPDTIQ
jgi:CRISPR/Cas system CMR-associated protein Cmr5 small subunit